MCGLVPVELNWQLHAPNNITLGEGTLLPVDMTQFSTDHRVTQRLSLKLFPVMDIPDWNSGTLDTSGSRGQIF